MQICAHIQHDTRVICQTPDAGGRLASMQVAWLQPCASDNELYTCILCAHSLETIKVLIQCNLQTEHDMEMKLTSIDFSCRVAEDSRSSWLQILDKQLNDRSPYTRYTHHKYYLLCTIT